MIISRLWESHRTSVYFSSLLKEIHCYLNQNNIILGMVLFLSRLKECTLALIPLLSNYVLHDDQDLFCVAPRGNILAFSSLSFT
ncbi:hypothetical protein T05_11141 [Trichinella murrelli]|uniref:Uncharacterized protein n=1 Tax=Trichinella murrelli TaxID=144512 RepID=A0A0V0U3M9_9BILA|nr:hypothetical protein T05_11141 [Trichinella murrelli]